MLRAKTKNEIDIIMQELIEKVKPLFGDKLKKVVLYGSYARGDYDEESDVDVMFLVDKEEEELRKDVKKVIILETEIGLQYDVFISPLLQSYAKFLKYLPVLPFYQNVEKEGIVIYEQG
ncbi:MAG: nucleotidyltransferase domain-containing protein [Dethiobacter sp.]|jgi:predicted nucleotidyltransferase|nr:MAG: nucleotidyltransferase domain-containing protein [Dethiobacter sp.]